MFEGMPLRGQGPAQVAARRGGADARARPGRGARRGDGQRDQLQHGLDVDLRAAVDLRLPRAATAASRRSPQAPRPALPRRRARTWPASCCGPAPGVHAWKPGDEVVAHCLSVELESPDGHDDTMLDPEQRIWGFETNFGGLAELALVKANQLMPKPAHLTWEEAACPGLVNSTAYRQLVSRNGAGHEAGRHRADLGRVAAASAPTPPSIALNGGAIPVCVVSSPREGRARAAGMGAELVIDRTAEGYKFWRTSTTRTPRSGSASGQAIRELTGGDDPDIVFEHPGRETFGASVYVARSGGTIVTCASTSRLPARVRQPLPVDEPQAHRRLALRQLPRVVGGQPADRQGADPPDAVEGLPAGGDRPGRVSTCTATRTRARSACCASRPREGLGVANPEKRARHLDAINRFRGT